MLTLGPVAFLTPWLLPALVALPVLWLILRAIPPGPRRLSFPGVRLLLGLDDPERTPDRTPWWLLLLRCLIVGAAILAFAQPLLNPRSQFAGSGPLLLVMDGGWASAPDWEQRRARATEVLDKAERAGRPVHFVVLARPAPADARLDSRPAPDWRGEIETLQPSPWPPQRAAFAERVLAQGPRMAEVVWITDGLDHGGDDRLAEVLADLGPLTVIEPAATAIALTPPALQNGQLAVDVLRARAGQAETVTVAALGAGEDGAARRLGQAEASFGPEAMSATAVFDLPLELRNRVERLSLPGTASAAALVLADDGVRRRRAALVSGGSDADGQQLVSDLHFLRTALGDRAEIVEGTTSAVLDRRPDALFLADVGRFTEAEAEALSDWVERGGLLVRFAGPRLARGADAPTGMAPEDALLPVRLRAGDRSVGGAMAWTRPQGVRPFPEGTPFAGLDVTDEVTVSRQILAELGPDLPARTWAALEDGTPLVTAAERGAGRVVLFHVTANAEWSSLPLSGLFVEMMGRLLQSAGGTGDVAERAMLSGVTARPERMIDGFGRIVDAGALPGVPADRLAEPAGPDAPPGLYAVGQTMLAHNLLGRDASLRPLAPLPGGTVVERLGGRSETALGPWLLALAVLLLAADTVASLAVSGRLALRPRHAAAAGIAALMLAHVPVPQAAAETLDDDVALRATLETVIAYVVTGDAEVDRLSRAGLEGLSRMLTARTSVEPSEPVGVNLETDEIALFPMLYWPITTTQPTLSDAAIGRLNGFMRTGGMIVFDTRDRHLEIGRGTTPNGEALRRLAGRLDLPALEPVPADHVLTRTFFLLDGFPGRHSGGRVWVEATPPVAADAAPEDMVMRNANDGVSPVLIGSHDWAAAWAIDEAGQPLAPLGGRESWRQREMAMRFGINLVMYVLTGNYKSDQVHVPALLERLGQ